MMIARIIFLTLLFYGSLVNAITPDAVNGIAGMRIFTALTYTESEGEWYGIQIALVPHFRGKKILWRSGSGRIEPALLLDVNQEGNLLKVVVPKESDDFGEWRLVMDGKLLRASGPRGLSFVLKEVHLK